MKIAPLLLLLSLFAISASLIAAQGGNSLSETLPTDTTFSSSDIDHAIVFPDHANLNFPTASLVDTYIGFKNLGKQTYNVTTIYGSINHLGDPNIYLQNLTRLRYDVIVRPNDDVTFEFQFVADPSLEPQNYHMYIIAEYHDVSNGFVYSATFVNGTVTILESAQPFDWTGTVVTLVIVGLTGAFLAKNYLNKKAAKAAKAAKNSKLDQALAGTTVNLSSFGKSDKGPKSPKGKN